MVPDKEIIKEYNRCGSVKQTASTLQCSWQTVAKALSTAGIVATESQALVLSLHEQGMPIDYIVSQTGLSKKVVGVYLPRVKPQYGLEDCSENARKIRKCRKRKRCQIS